MGNITVTIPDASLQRIINGFTGMFNYAENGGGLNEAQFTKKQVILYIKHIVKTYEAGQASKTSEATIGSEIDGINIT
jgi:hypothetical protein